MVKYAIGLLVVGALLGTAKPAEAIYFTPEQTTCTAGAVSTEALAVYEALDLCFDVQNAELELVYARDLTSGEEGGYASSYGGAFNPSGTAGRIDYTGGSSFFCVECFLVVSDLTNSAQYLFNLTTWNGADVIQFGNFWPGPERITNVAVWGSSTPLPEPSFEPGNTEPSASVPEPATLMLMGLGAIGAARSMRRRAQ